MAARRGRRQRGIGVGREAGQQGSHGVVAVAKLEPLRPGLEGRPHHLGCHVLALRSLERTRCQSPEKGETTTSREKERERE